MQLPVTLTLVDGVGIAVPDSLEQVTTYVLREQLDWFEDEIRFVRQLLQPGQRVIDIGANYGVYTLSMARAVGPAGKVWAFEPASLTASFLAESVQANGFAQVVLDQRALSATAGTAQLSIGAHAELNELVRGNAVSGQTETVRLTTLDEAMRQYDWQDIDFIKIDAEGEEEAIVRGGTLFFQTLSPLVQFEVKAGEVAHLELVRAFADVGYTSYRLLPGLGVLVPFDLRENLDESLLNLFCCKPDRAQSLAEQAVLVRASDMPQSGIDGDGNELLQRCNASGKMGWAHSLTSLAYGRQLAEVWQQGQRLSGRDAVDNALALHAISGTPSFQARDRVMALGTSFRLLQSASALQPDGLRLASLARVAQALGAKAVAATAWMGLIDRVEKNRGQIDLSEPFLSSHTYFDQRDPADALSRWVASSAFEGLERTISHSSFFTGEAARERLQLIQQLGFGSPEMGRRLQLVQTRFSG